MKLTCSICKGQLIMDPGGEFASCIDCGMGYTTAHLVQMIHPAAGQKSMGKKMMLNSVAEEMEKSRTEALFEEAKIEPVKIRILRSESGGFQVRNLHCVVESGSFDLTGLFYVDDDEKKTIKLGLMKQGKEYIKTAEKGMEIMLPVCGTQIKLLKDAQYLTAPLALCGSDEEEEYFLRILASCFKDCTIKRNICVTDVKPAVPVTFMLYKKNKPVLAIILCSSRVYDHRKILNTMRACEKHHIKVQRYFAEFENDREYVIQRIRKAL